MNAPSCIGVYSYSLWWLLEPKQHENGCSATNTVKSRNEVYTWNTTTHLRFLKYGTLIVLMGRDIPAYYKLIKIPL